MKSDLSEDQIRAAQSQQAQGMVWHPVGQPGQIPGGVQQWQGGWHPSWLHAQNISIIAAGLCMNSDQPSARGAPRELALAATQIYREILTEAAKL